MERLGYRQIRQSCQRRYITVVIKSLARAFVAQQPTFPARKVFHLYGEITTSTGKYFNCRVKVICMIFSRANGEALMKLCGFATEDFVEGLRCGLGDDASLISGVKDNGGP